MRRIHLEQYSAAIPQMLARLVEDNAIAELVTHYAARQMPPPDPIELDKDRPEPCEHQIRLTGGDVETGDTKTVCGQCQEELRRWPKVTRIPPPKPRTKRRRRRK